MIEVRRNRKGRGIYATAPIAKGALIESCHVIVLPRADVPDHQKLAFYIFEWGDDEYAVCLGNGSLFNHSFEPNARYRFRMDRERIEFVALRDIRGEEEVFVNYNGDPSDQSPVSSSRPGSFLPGSRLSAHEAERAG